MYNIKLCLMNELMLFNEWACLEHTIALNKFKDL